LYILKLSISYTQLTHFVIGLVGLCCKPQPLVIIIIIINRGTVRWVFYVYSAESCVQLSIVSLSIRSTRKDRSVPLSWPRRMQASQ